MQRIERALVLVVLSGGCFSPPERPDIDGGSSDDTTSDDTTSTTETEPSASSDATTGSSESGGVDTESDPTGSEGDPTVDDGLTTTGSDSTDSGEIETCPPERSCVPAAPQGWSGPIALARGDTDATLECGGDFPQLAFDGGQDLQVPEASCSCSCTAELQCQGPTTLQGFANSNCTGPGQSFSVSAGEATAVGIPARRGWRASSITTSVVDADVSSDHQIPEPSFSSVVIGCATTTSQADCEDGSVCAPGAGGEFEDRLCIWREGEHDCDASAGYSERTLVYGDAVDERTCSSCGFLSATGSCASSYVVGATAFTVFPEIPTSSTCVFASNANDGEDLLGAQLVIQPPTNVTCTATNSALSGSVQLEDPVTVCCAP